MYHAHLVNVVLMTQPHSLLFQIVIHVQMTRQDVKHVLKITSPFQQEFVLCVNQMNVA